MKLQHLLIFNGVLCRYVDIELNFRLRFHGNVNMLIQRENAALHAVYPLLTKRLKVQRIF